MAKLPKDEEIREGLRRLTQSKSRFYYEDSDKREHDLQRGAKIITDVTGSLGVWGIKQ